MIDPADETSLLDSIRAIAADSERLFLSLGEEFPTVVRELRSCLDGAERSLRAFGSPTETVDSGLSGSMRSLFSRVRDTINAVGERFAAIHEQDEALLVSLGNGIDVLSSLGTTIDKIRDDSVEMELISLNAMTAALKSGSTGKAFSVITEELKRLSGRTIALTEGLTEAGRLLLGEFSAFRDELRGAEDRQTELFVGLGGRIREIFSDLEARVSAIADTLGELVGRAKGVEIPVRDIMETVQVQDILRQSLDHVSSVITTSSEEGRGTDLDGLCFRRSLAQLSATLLRDISDTLRRSRESFAGGAAEVAKIMEDGEGRRRALLSPGDASGGATLAVAFERAGSTLESLRKEIDGYLRSKRAIASTGARLSGSVERLEAGFKEFSKILTRFRTIDIASRIEVAKLSALQGMRETVQEMSALTLRIGSDVDEALDATKGFMETARSSIGEYGAGFDSSAALMGASEAELGDSHRALAALGDSLNDGISHFSIFSPDFVASVSLWNRDIAALDELETSIQDVLSVLDGETRALEESLRATGTPEASWNVRSERLQQLIDRFTIYAHKRLAGELGGFSVEGGEDTGLVTFF